MQSADRVKNIRARNIAPWITLVAAAGAFALEPSGFVPPEFLVGPQVTRAASGNTYSFTGRAPHPDARLQFTRVEIPSRAPAHDGVFCARAFLNEVGSHATGFFVQPDRTALTLAGITFATYRWTGRLAGDATTGIVACGVTGEHYVAITFQDALPRAARSFPAIRARLSRLVFK